MYLLICHQITMRTAAVFRTKLQRRRRFLVNRRSTALLFGTINVQKRRRQIKTRSRDWWENIVSTDKFSHSEWLENFRMSKDTFQIVCNELRPFISPKPSGLDVYWRLKRKLTVEKKVAVSLYFLASCCEYRVVGNQFGIHKSTVCKVLHEFVSAVNRVLAPKYIKFPNTAEAVQSASLFSHKSKIPNIIGAIDGSHIPILPPTVGYRDFINRKGWPSIVLQGVVDSKFKFLDISVKQPGRCHDMAVFVTSNLYKNIDQVMPESTVQINQRKLPWIIIGDPAYPILPWLLKGFSGPNLTEVEESFNVYLNSAQVSVEIAFGRLKGRWRCLMKRLDVHHNFVPHLVATYCTLHNIVETYKDDFVANWLDAVQEAEVVLQQPTHTKCSSTEDYAGYDLRIFLAEYLATNYPLRKSHM